MFMPTESTANILDRIEDRLDRLDELVSQIAHAEAELAALREVVKASDALREKMKTVYETTAYKSVWSLHMVHGGKYPSDDDHNWISEQEAYDAARAKVTLP